MNKKCLRKAQESFFNARSACENLENAQTFPESEHAWSDFLVQVCRIYLRLEVGTEGNNKSAPWFGRLKHIQKTDSLIRYICHARNADEHNFLNFDVKQNAKYISGLGNSEEPITTCDALQQDINPTLTIEFSVEGYLVPFEDNKIMYEIPTEHLGQALEDCRPVMAAKLVLKYLEKVISEAEQMA